MNERIILIEEAAQRARRRWERFDRLAVLATEAALLTVYATRELADLVGLSGPERKMLLGQADLVETLVDELEEEAA